MLNLSETRRSVRFGQNNPKTTKYCTNDNNKKEAFYDEKVKDYKKSVSLNFRSSDSESINCQQNTIEHITDHKATDVPIRQRWVISWIIWIEFWTSKKYTRYPLRRENWYHISILFSDEVISREAHKRSNILSEGGYVGIKPGIWFMKR